MSVHSFQPVFLVGAARSGTKLLRDVIGENYAFDRVPYDINYIWRLGNQTCPHDELKPDHLTPAIVKRITCKLEVFCKGAPYLIEKTVSNCLRLPFVDSIYPNAKYIFLVRDGRDVIESSYRQWVAHPDWKYVLEKARSFPLLDAPGYALSYAFGLFRKRLVRNSNQIPTWGPRYEGIDQDVKAKDLIEVCAIQWAQSIKKATAALQMIDTKRFIVVKYEDFVQNPRLILDMVGRFLNVSLSSSALPTLTHANIGKGWSKLGVNQRELVYPLIQDALELTGYIS